MESIRIDWPDGMVDLIREVSDELPEEAEQLFEEDDGSLDRYVGSEAFLEDLMEAEQSIDVDVETFFAILFKQFHRKLTKDETFRDSYRNALEESPSTNWDLRKTRQFFKDEDLIRYLIKMLQGFLDAEKVHQLPVDDDEDYHYIVDMLDAAVDASDVEKFQIFCHIGNYSLYLTGIFPDWVRHRHRYKNRPMDIDSYRDYGKTYYERAAEHQVARKQDLRPVLVKLHSGYDLVRTTLNMMFDELNTDSF
jgi:hypothetical protein